MQRGVMLLGAYIALTSPGTVPIGGLVAFMMLSSRVAQPLASLAKLMEDIGEVRTATALAASVLNQNPETANPSAGLRPRFRGSISFHKVTYSYPGTTHPALNQIGFGIGPGTVLGIVGRSGSGKSTITRLLQGIGRDYRGQICIDGFDLRDINLAHLPATSASCCRTTSCSAALSPRIFWPAVPGSLCPMPCMPPGLLGRPSSSRNCPTVMKHLLKRAPRIFPVVSGSASRSPVPWSMTRAF